MNQFASAGTATSFMPDLFGSWTELPRPLWKARGRRGTTSISAFPGLAITAAVSEDEQNRRTLNSVLIRFASERLITRTTLRAAECFIEALPRGRKLPKVCPDEEGGLTMAWDVPGRGRTIITLSEWMVYAVANAGTLDSQYFDDSPFDGGVIDDEILTVIP